MQNLKLERETIKGSLKKVFKEIEEVNPSDEKTIQRLLQQVDDKAERVFLLDNSIKDILFAEETSTETISKELNDEENFRDEVGKFRIECEYLIKNLKTLKDQENKGTKNEKPVKNLHLPKLEIKKYDGNVKNWINFWGQFRKIDEDADLPNEDKFQYLIQSTEDGTPARSLVESFPPSAENYKIAIDQLKNRFARDEILIEVYVRELLNLILNQQTSKEDPGMALSTLYDRLETQLRALGTLGVTSDKYAAMLLPLVESALPYELLKIWERNRASNNLKFNNELQGLLEFLKTEVEAEERVKLAQSSFTVPKSIDDKYTVETLHTESLKTKGKQKFSCIFCESNTHASQDCIKAQKMTLEQKKSIISKKRSCFSCLKQFHNFRTCKTTVKCIKCARKHFTLMCPDLHEKENKNRDLQKSESLENTLTTVASETLLQTINVRVISDNKRSMTVRALLDSGSQRSYITTKCAEDLGLTKIGQENIVQGVFGGLQGAPKIHRLFKAGIENLENSFSIGLSLLEQSKICNYVPKLIDQKVLDLLKDKNIYINDSASKELEVNLLIGADMFGHIITGNLVNINDSLVALETKFGWTVMGTQKSNNKINTFVSTYFTDSLSTLWSLDVLGIKDPAETKCREELDIRTLEKFKESTVVNSENRYEVCLPWAEGYPAITSNFNLAEKRLFSTTKRLLSLNKLTEYDNIFQDWENTGIIEEVEEEPLEKNTHYLAHHAVVKESSLTTKIRPVFDASAKDGNGNSLNDLLEKGPNLIELIIPLILKFRLHKIGVTSDIAKAFLQISISEKDRDFLRFLWWKNYEKREIKIFRHCRVVFGLKPSPFLLAATVNLHLEKEKTYTETANQLLNAFYVDNCVFSVRNETELKKFIDESTEILKNAKFDLRGWTFNENNDTYVSSVNEKLENKVISILGIQWNYQTDTLACDIKNLDSLDEIPRTKRGILSATQRVFDPIGFTAPFTLIPKILLQETWSLKLTWDQKLPDDIKKRFEIWLKSVKCLNFCNIHRYLAYPEEENLIINKTLHVFVDASKYAYAACVFIRLEFQNSISIKLLLAKSRLSPVKTITLPRLELMAAVIGVRLLETVKEVTDFTELKTYYWSDSMVVLTWIKTKGLWNTFVGNRVKEIKKYSAVDQWRHVPGDMNIADVLSRGCSGKQLLEKQWWKGPQWLKEPENMWPKGEVSATEEEAMKECMKLVNTNLAENSEEFCQKLNYFGKFSKVRRLVGWILRFYHNVRNKRRRTCVEAKTSNKFDYLNAQELERAETCIIKFAQTQNLTENIKGLRKFEIFEDKNGILRLKTRLAYGDFSQEFKYPIILPSKNTIVRKLLVEEHEKSCHAGPKILLGIIRENFWLIKARKTINSVIYSCVTCKKLNGKQIETPFAPLPANRINDAGVFEIVGIDLAGPLYLKGGEKTWIVLFTCAVYRALHLELVKSLSTEAFLYALRRFISRRGRPKIIYSDNGTNFHGSDNIFGKLNWVEIEQFSGTRRIKWIFNPPSASWWGGWWERLVRVVKELLRRQLGKASLHYVELYTVLCDIESVINQRPLTYVSEVDEFEVLTPSSFLKPLQGNSDEVVDLDIVDSEFFKGRFRHIQNLRQMLRDRFRKEYLAELVNYGQRREDFVKVGDVVMVGSDNVKRINWPMGKIIEVYSGQDGIQRVAKVKTKNGVLVRPCLRLYRVELPINDIQENLRKDKEESTEQDKSEKGKKSRYGRTLKTPHRFTAA